MEHSLNIVLIEPEIPQNTGNIARTCAATGARLHLVGPMGFKITDKQVKRAGLDYWDKLDISYYDSTEEFFEKNQDGTFYYFTTKAEQAHTDVQYPNHCYLVFGKETKGCLRNCSRQITIIAFACQCAALFAVLIYQTRLPSEHMKHCVSGTIPNCRKKVNFIICIGNLIKAKINAQLRFSLSRAFRVLFVILCQTRR